jgi:hypothetical protein
VGCTQPSLLLPLSLCALLYLKPGLVCCARHMTSRRMACHAAGVARRLPLP